MTKKDQEAIAKLLSEMYDWENPYIDDIKKIRNRQVNRDEKDYGLDSALKSTSFIRDRPHIYKSKGTNEYKYHNDGGNGGFNKYRPSENIGSDTYPETYYKLSKDLNMNVDDIYDIVMNKFDQNENLTGYFEMAEDGNDKAYYAIIKQIKGID